MSQRLFVAEPPQRHRVLPPLVVDCSTLAGLVFQEERQHQATERIGGKDLHAPSVLSFEVAWLPLPRRIWPGWPDGTP